MTDPMNNPRDPGETDPADDIEILEVVGIDEDAPPASVPDDEAEDADEIEVVFDGGETRDRVSTIEAPGPPAATDTVARERLLRLQADFDNLRKRIDRERDEHYRHATGSLVARLLPVIDNFERAIVSGRQAARGDALREGLELVHRQLLEELRREGLRDIEALGLAFDPAVHEAVATDPGSPLPPNTVVEELQRGYFFHDRVLRPALVRVSVDPGEHEAPGDGAKES